MPCAARFSEPAQMTSSDLRIRSARPCSPERPAQRVREVALAGAVGPDDGADPGPELDQRPLGERLEALERGPTAGAPARSCAAARRARSARVGRRGARRPRRGRRRRALARASRTVDRLAPRPPSRRRGATGPRPTPSDLAVDRDLDPERLLVVRPDRLDDAVDGPPAGRSAACAPGAGSSGLLRSVGARLGVDLRPRRAR